MSSDIKVTVVTQPSVESQQFKLYYDGENPEEEQIILAVDPGSGFPDELIIEERNLDELIKVIEAYKQAKEVNNAS